MEQPSPHQSPSGLPRRRPIQAGARTVTLETRTVFVTITSPTAADNPCPSTPLPDQEASLSATFHRERYRPTWPRDLQPGRPGSFWTLFGGAEAI